MTKFADLGLTESTLAALAHLGYERPTPIQEQAIPPLLEGRDVIGQAQTGTGKTAAFGLPMVEYVDTEAAEIQALVLTPTRELCIQVTQALRAYGERKGVEVVAVFVGAPIRGPAPPPQEGHVGGGTHRGGVEQIRRLAEQFMHDPVEIKVRAATLTIDTVDHYYVEVRDGEKPEALVPVLKH